jgi:hypothetical protein
MNFDAPAPDRYDLAVKADVSGTTKTLTQDNNVLSVVPSFGE